MVHRLAQADDEEIHMAFNDESDDWSGKLLLNRPKYAKLSAAVTAVFAAGISSIAPSGNSDSNTCWTGLSAEAATATLNVQNYGAEDDELPSMVMNNE